MDTWKSPGVCKLANKQELVNPATGGVIPDYLKGLPGVSTGHEIPTLNESRIVLASRPGKGKSTLLNSNPKAFVLGPEWGGKTVANPKAIRFGPMKRNGKFFSPTSQEYRDVLEKVFSARKKGATEFEMLGIDTLNSAVDLFARELLASYKVTDLKQVAHGAGFTMTGDFVHRMLADAEQSGMGWCCCVHVGTRTIRTDDGEKLVHDMTLWPTIRNLIEGPCDHRFYMEKAEVDVTETKMVAGKPKEIKVGSREVAILEVRPGLKFKPGQYDDVKVRVPFEDEIVISQENGWSDLEAAYAKAVERLTASRK